MGAPPAPMAGGDVASAAAGWAPTKRPPTRWRASTFTLSFG